jgi:hypothetical protein
MLRRLEAHVGHPANIVADPAPVTLLVRAAIVPAVCGRHTVGEPVATHLAEQLALGAVVPVERQLRPEGPLAITAR